MSKVLRVRVKDLRVHPTAQRRLVPATLKKIDAEMDVEHGIGVLHAVQYVIGGILALWVVDGQHRLTVLQRAGLADLEVDVMVHEDVTDDAGASRLFRILNTRASVSAHDTYVNALQEGIPEAVGVSQIVQKNGLRIERYSADGTITCVSALMNLYRKDRGETLDKTLSTAAAAWGHVPAAVEGKLIEGLGLVYGTYNGKIESPALVKKLAKNPGGAAGLLGNAKAIRSMRKASLGRCVAELVVELYNSGRREKLDAL